MRRIGKKNTKPTRRGGNESYPKTIPRLKGNGTLRYSKFIDCSFELLDRFFLLFFRSHKDNLKQVDAQEEQRLLRGQRAELDLELRKFRRMRLMAYHQLEQVSFKAYEMASANIHFLFL